MQEMRTGELRLKMLKDIENVEEENYEDEDNTEDESGE